MWNVLGLVVLANVYLAFPDGRTAGWSRRLSIAVYAWFFLLTVGQRLVHPYPSSWAIRNPLLLWPNEGLADSLGMVANLGALVLTILVVGTVLDRWRRGSPVARRALAPVFWVSPITLVVNGTFFVARVIGSDTLFAVSTGPLAQLSNFLLPIAFLVGLLQTRLERGSIADLVRDLDGVRTGDLEAALARAVHDPTLRLAFPTPDGSGYVDPAGRPVEAPARRRSARRHPHRGDGPYDRGPGPRPGRGPGAGRERRGSVAARPGERAAGRRAPGPARGGPGFEGADRRGDRRGAAQARARPPRRGAAAARGPRVHAPAREPARRRGPGARADPRRGEPRARGRPSGAACARPRDPSDRARRRSCAGRPRRSPTGSRSRSRSTSRTGGSRRRSRRPPTSSSPRR